VADGRKALLLINQGDADYLDLRVQETIEAAVNPPTSEQGCDRPGRTGTMLSRRRSAVGQTDWHRINEEKFAANVVERLFTHATPSALVLSAPPTFLAQLRRRLPKHAKDNVVAGFNRDLTHLAVHDIERMIMTATPPFARPVVM
jgi:protein required for attachment to host cells